MFSPILEEVKQKQIKIAVNKSVIDQFEEEAMMDVLRSVPTLIYYKDGKVKQKRVSGVLSKKKFQKLLRK